MSKKKIFLLSILAFSICITSGCTSTEEAKNAPYAKDIGVELKIGFGYRSYPSVPDFPPYPQELLREDNPPEGVVYVDVYVSRWGGSPKILGIKESPDVRLNNIALEFIKQKARIYKSPNISVKYTLPILIVAYDDSDYQIANYERAVSRYYHKKELKKKEIHPLNETCKLALEILKTEPNPYIAWCEAKAKIDNTPFDKNNLPDEKDQSKFMAKICFWELLNIVKDAGYREPPTNSDRIAFKSAIDTYYTNKEQETLKSRLFGEHEGHPLKVDRSTDVIKFCYTGAIGAIPETNCIYQYNGMDGQFGSLNVMQVIGKVGELTCVLARKAAISGYDMIPELGVSPSKILMILARQNYASGDTMKPAYILCQGTKTYDTAIGSNTVYSFIEIPKEFIAESFKDLPFLQMKYGIELLCQNQNS